MLFSIAWRNIWRNRLRSGVVMIAVGLGLFGGVFSVAFMEGMGRQRVRSAIRTEVSHIQLHDSTYVKEQDLRFVFDEPRVMRTLRELEYVRSATPRLEVQAMARTAATGAGVTLYGVDPSVERTVTNIADKITEGSFFGSDRRNPVVLGRELAAKLRTDIGSKVVLTMQQMDSSMTAGAFRVVGVYETTNAAFDERAVFVKRGDLADLIGIAGGKVHEIVVLLSDNDALETTARSLRREFPALTVRTWRQIQPSLSVIDSMLDTTNQLFILIILLALAFGIVNTMLMAILERRKELGMLMAIGMSKARLFGMIVLETVLLAVTGGVVGMAVGGAAIAWTFHTGVDLSRFAAGLTEVGYDPIVRPVIDPVFFVQLSALIVATGIVSALYPAVKALSLHPAEALRTE